MEHQALSSLQVIEENRAARSNKAHLVVGLMRGLEHGIRCSRGCGVMLKFLLQQW